MIKRTSLGHLLSLAGQRESEHDRLCRVVEDNYDGLFRYLRRLGVSPEDAEDAIQEVLLRMATRLVDIALGKERAFAYGTAFRVASEWRRVVRREVRADDFDAIEADDPTPDESWDDKRARTLLDRIIAEMPIELRAVFVLYEIEEHTMAEIAEELSIPAGTVASRLRRARDHFEQAVARAERRPLRRRDDAPGARGA